MEVEAPARVGSPLRGLSESQFLGFIIFSWLVLNLGLNFFNKAALGAHTALHFTYPLFYTGFHQLASLCFSSLAFYLHPPLNTLSYASFKQHRGMLLLLGLTFFISLACNNASLVMIGLSVNGLIKSTLPLPAMLLSYIFEKKSYPKPVIASVVGMVASAMIAIPYGDDDNASVLGLSLAIASTASLAMRPVLCTLLLRDSAETGLTPLVLVWYDAVISTSLLFVTSMMFETRGLGEYFRTTPWQGIGLLVLPSLMAFAYNIVMFWLPKLLGSLTPCILGNARQVFVLIVSVAFVDHLTSAWTLIGVALFSLFCALYTLFVVREMRADASRARQATPLSPAEATALRVKAQSDLLRATQADLPPLLPRIGSTEFTPLIRA